MISCYNDKKNKKKNSRTFLTIYQHHKRPTTNSFEFEKNNVASTKTDNLYPILRIVWFDV